MKKGFMLLILVVFLASCGGGDSGSTSSNGNGQTTPVVTTISIITNLTQIKTSQTMQISAKILDQYGKEILDQNVNWSVSEPLIADISATGLLIAKRPGKIKITASVSNKSAVIDIDVIQASLRSIEVSANKSVLIKDEILQLKTTVIDEFGNILTTQNLKWSSSDQNIISVDSTGSVRALGYGRAVITASSGDTTGLINLEVRSPEFAISCHPQLTLRPGSTGTFVCSSVSDQGAIEGLTVSITNVDPNLTLRILTDTTSLSGNGTDNFYFSVDLSGDAVNTSYNATVKFNAFNLEKSATITVNAVSALAKLHVLYIIPSDKAFKESRRAGIERAMRHGQIWFQKEMANGKTFTLNKDVVNVLYSDKPTSWFQSNFNSSYEMTFWLNTLSEANRMYGARQSDPANTWLLYIDADPLAGQIGGAGATGVSVLPANDIKGVSGEQPDSFGICRWIGGMLHELGHALYLPHPPGCDEGLASCDSNALMWTGYSSYPVTYLRDDEKSLLNQDSEIVKHDLSTELFDCEKTGKY